MRLLVSLEDLIDVLVGEKRDDGRWAMGRGVQQLDAGS